MEVYFYYGISNAVIIQLYTIAIFQQYSLTVINIYE
jgi:hypothetical protein